MCFGLYCSACSNIRTYCWCIIYPDLNHFLLFDAFLDFVIIRKLLCDLLYLSYWIFLFHMSAITPLSVCSVLDDAERSLLSSSRSAFFTNSLPQGKVETKVRIKLASYTLCFSTAPQFNWRQDKQKILSVFFLFVT